MSIYNTAAVFDAIDNISKVAQGIGSNVEKMAGAVGQTMSSMGKGFDTMGEALQVVATGPVGMLEAGLSVVVRTISDFDNAMRGVSARTGLTGAALDKFRDQAKELFASGLVDNFDDAARAIEVMKTDLSGLDDAKVLQHFATNAFAVADAWDTSVDKVIGSVDKMQSVFDNLADKPGIALDILVTTAQQAHMSFDEVSKVVEKVGSKFAAAGLSAGGMGGMIVKAADAGIGPAGFPALTKALDTFHDRASNPPVAFTNAMKKMGLGDVLKDFKDNKITMDKLLDEVLTKFGELPEGPDKTAKAVALFGTNFNNLGGLDIPGKLAGFSTALGDVRGAADKVADTMRPEGTLGGALDKFSKNVTIWIDDIYKAFAGVNWNEALAQVFPKMMGLVTGFIDNATRPITSFVSSIWLTLSNADWGGAISSVINSLVNVISSGLTTAGLIVWLVLFGIKTTIETTWNNIVKFVNGIVGAVSKAFAAVGSAIETALGPALKVIEGILANMQAIANFTGTGGPASAADALLQQAKNQTPPFAQGGSLREGFNLVGDAGPELIFKRGGMAEVFSNSESRSMVGAGSSGGGVNVYATIGTLVGSGGMDEFVRVVKRGLQDEDRRRGGAE